MRIRVPSSAKTAYEVWSEGIVRFLDTTLNSLYSRVDKLEERITARTPATATAEGIPGQVCWDANFVYVCVAKNTWKRAAIVTW
jgi:hypothetical protein